MKKKTKSSTLPKLKNPKSHLEIERKFLLKKFPQEVINKYKANLQVLNIIQYYFFIDGIWQRYRKVDTLGKKTKFIHTIKHSIQSGIYEELENSVPEKDFLKKQSSNKKNYAVIKKTRYVIKHNKLKFEIDVYKGLRMVILEVELPTLSHSFEYPEGLQQEIVYELTGIKQFSNFSLATKHKKQ